MVGAAAVLVAGLAMTERRPDDKKPDAPIVEVKPKPNDEQPKPIINDPPLAKPEEPNASARKAITRR